MRKSKIILSLLTISMLASKTFAVNAVNLENEVISYYCFFYQPVQTKKRDIRCHPNFSL